MKAITRTDFNFPGLTEKYTGPDIKGIKIDYTPLTAGKDSTLTLTFK